MTRDTSKLNNLTWKHGGFVTYGDNNRGRILNNGDVGECKSIQGCECIIFRDSTSVIVSMSHKTFVIYGDNNKGSKSLEV